METRLSSLVEQGGYVSFSELYYQARQDENLEKEIIDALSTNETDFFRDISPFELLQYKILPDLFDKRATRLQSSGKIPLRIWSMGCATGQEVYSIAFTLSEMGLDLDKYDIRILGTDISNAVIAKASYAHYTSFELSRGLSLQQMRKYFDQIDENDWKVKDEYRWLIFFETHNIFDARPSQKKFDIIFCRNMGIYFSPECRDQMYSKIFGLIEPDGYLVVGSTESLAQAADRFGPQRHMRTVFYQPVTGPAF